jgi:hypothetical protein
MSQSILNYTTTVEAAKSIAEITRILAAHRAVSILTDFDNGQPVAISFRIQTGFGLMTFRLPAEVEKVFAVLHRSRISPRFKTREQAGRVAWRICKDWVEAQMALIRMGQVELEQIFLPYAQDSQGITLYERMKTNRFGGLLALPE